MIHDYQILTTANSAPIANNRNAPDSIFLWILQPHAAQHRKPVAACFLCGSAHLSVHCDGIGVARLTFFQPSPVR